VFIRNLLAAHANGVEAIEATLFTARVCDVGEA
jgi:hypothetical protein